MYLGDDDGGLSGLGDDDGGLSGFGDDSGLGCDCRGGLQGIGLTPPSTNGDSSTWGRIITAGENIIDKYLHPTTPYTLPPYTPPYLPSYPVNTQTPAQATQPGMFDRSPWLPWAIGGGLLLYALSRR